MKQRKYTITYYIPVKEIVSADNYKEAEKISKDLKTNVFLNTGNEVFIHSVEEIENV